MGIWKRKVVDGYHYQIEWKDEFGNRCKKTLKDRKLAERILKQKELEAERVKELGISVSKRILFEDFCGEYLRWSEKNKRSYRRDKVLIRNLSTHFGNKYLKQISPYLIEQYRMERQREVKKSTINRETSCLKAIFNKAILWDKFRGENPMRKIKLYDEQERTRYLTESEMEKFYQALYHKDAPSMIRNICLCALNTGMRKEEILSLRWTDINWKNKTITIMFTKNNRVKTVPINEQLENVLRSIVEYDNCPYVFYHTLNQKRVRYNDIKKAFKGILKRAGIENFTVHDLRHTTGSYLRKAGVDLIVIKTILGHQDVRSTMRYTHLFDKEKSQALSRLELVFPRTGARGKSEVKEVKNSKNSLKLTATKKSKKRR